MPKVLLYISAKITWIFLFYGTDANENRAHVHVAKKGLNNVCKIWLEPEVELSTPGDLTESQIKQVLKIVQENKSKLLSQWRSFVQGKKVKMITIKK